MLRTPPVRGASALTTCRASTFQFKSLKEIQP
jgi:hypothetical protein